MATNLLNLIGGAASIATLFDFLIPENTVAERGNCMVTVQVGLDGTEGFGGALEGAGGNYPYITLHNNNNDQIGATLEPDMLANTIDSGAFKTLEIGTGSGQQAVAFSLQPGNDDQLCIASVTVTWPDQQKRAWIGDNGVACQATWFPSGIIVSDDNYETGCVWVNNLATEQDPYLSLGFIVDFRAFNGRDPSLPDEINALSDEDFFNQWCRMPSQQFLNHFTGLPPSSLAARSTDEFRGQGRMANETRLVVSNSEQFSAKDVCDNAQSWGPDYVSLKDGLFCDMFTKTVKPLCAPDVEEECFQLDESTGSKHKRAIGSRSTYSKIVEQNPLKKKMVY